MGTSDLDRQIETLRRCEYIKEAEVKALCAKAREILVEESNVQRVDAPVTVRRPRHPRCPRRPRHCYLGSAWRADRGYARGSADRLSVHCLSARADMR